MAIKSKTTKKKKPVKKAVPKKVAKKQPKKAAKKTAPKKAVKPVVAKTGGRPPVYSQEMADRLCEMIATSSKSLRTICKEEGMPSVGTVLKWLKENTNGFLSQYARAKEEQADLLVEEMIDISDDGSNDFMTIVKNDISYEVENKEWTSRSKLRVETRKWIASKLKPKKYGEKLDLNNTYTDKDGNPTNPPKQVMIIGGKEIEF